MNIQKTNKEITQKLKTQENTLKVKLHRFYLQNIKHRQEPTDILRKVYGNRIKAVIREAVEKAYFTGVDLTKKTVQEIQPNKIFFISGTDVLNIQDITEKMNQQFWATTTRLHQREHEFELTLDKELIKKKEFDTEANFIRIASNMVMSGFNNSIISKTRQVVAQNVR